MSRMRLRMGSRARREPWARIQSIRDRRAMLPLFDKDAALRRTGSPPAFLGKVRGTRCPRQVVALVPRRGRQAGGAAPAARWVRGRALPDCPPDPLAGPVCAKGDRGVLEFLLQVLEGLAEPAGRERVMDPDWPPSSSKADRIFS